MKKIVILSIHRLGDNRIEKHIRRLLVEGYHVKYVNASASNNEAVVADKGLQLVHIPIPYVKASGIRILKIYRKMIRELKEDTGDVVHIHDPQLLPLAKTASRLGYKVVYDRHERYEVIPVLTAKVGTFFEQSYAKWVDGIVYVNPTQAEYINRLFKCETVMIPNYQSEQLFVGNKKRGLAKQIQFIYVGSLEESLRNILLMLRVMRRVLKEREQCGFVLGGTCNNDAVRKEIDVFSNETERFEYCGLIPYQEVVKKTRDSDVGLLFLKQCGNTEGASANKLYEYLLAGLVVIGMGNFMHSREVVEARAGIIFDYDTDEEEIVKQIIEIVDSYPLLKQLQKNAKELGKAFSWDEVADNYIALYDRLIMSERADCQKKIGTRGRNIS